MQLFQVKSHSGSLIMNAPLETLRWLFKLPTETVAEILHKTPRLEDEIQLNFTHRGKLCAVIVSRLPMEVPHAEAGVPEARLKEGTRDEMPAAEAHVQALYERRQSAARAAWDEQLPMSMRPQAGGPTRDEDTLSRMRYPDTTGGQNPLSDLLCDE